MSNVSIYDKNWIDLVFEDRNKKYGAYQLRQENARTTFIALLSGALLLLSIIGLDLLLSSFADKPDNGGIVICNLPLIRPVTIKPETEVKPVKPIATRAKPQQTTEKPNLDLSHMVVARPDDAVDVPANDHMDNTPVTNPSPNGGNGTDVSPITTPTAPAENPGTDDATPTVLLDKLPAYPGGINKFYEYIGYHFERPELDASTVITVLVSFVIEKDGSMTDVKVLRNPGYGMDREAVRVLNSLKTKWTPGIKDGEKVRTLYTLPIKIKSE